MNRRFKYPATIILGCTAGILSMFFWVDCLNTLTDPNIPVNMTRLTAEWVTGAVLWIGGAAACIVSVDRVIDGRRSR